MFSTSLSEVLSEQIPKCSELAYSNLFLFRSFQSLLIFHFWRQSYCLYINANRRQKSIRYLKITKLVEILWVKNIKKTHKLPSISHFTLINPLSLPSSTFFHAHCFQFLWRPWLPCSPLAPLGPIFPGDPAGPWSPLRPLSPCGPAGPWSPLAPSLPLSPGTPGTPGTPLVEVLMTVGHWCVTY